MTTFGKTAGLRAALVAAGLMASVSWAAASELNVAMFNNKTGLSTDTSAIQETWSALQQMGTDQFLGGVIGNFKLDESSMIAGALSLGVTEFDNFLRSGSVSSALGGNVLDNLTETMTGGAGINFSDLTGSFTSGGGQVASVTGSTAPTTFSSVSGGAQSDGACDPEIASALVANANDYVNQMTSAAQSDDVGFSQMESTSGGGQSNGFAGLGCLDKLFQNAGSDILFKPPSLSSLTSMLQTWSCDKAEGVAQQVAGAFGGGIDTSSLGGFFPAETMGEAFDGIGRGINFSGGPSNPFGFLSIGGPSGRATTLTDVFQ
ncbi:hypothetical protein [Roseibium sp. RKSG952]|uniref:hypothetical protein n=1 Tax=Roseibium sp. RKSG952 TaxID=2529384 RepID=UPI0012BBF899|nr:hypothetical protein [Roseibium sp. RKSG952]MTH96699.1 hypothetical protein [Roseibium sp. RKSG952]